MLRVCVIGAGSIGTRHIGHLCELGCAVSLVDVDPQRRAAAVAAHPEVRVTTGPSPVDRFDALVVASPYAHHYVSALMAIGSGVAVFVEKPIGPTTELALWRELADVARARGIVTQVGYQNRFHPMVEALRRPRLTKGIFTTKCDMRTWPGQSYGPLLLEASHDLDLALHLAGPDAVVTRAVMDPHFVRVELTTPDGGSFVVRLEDRADRYLREWITHGPQESVCVSLHTPEAVVGTTYYDEMAHFVECVQAGRQTDVPLRDGVRVLEMAAQVEHLTAKAA